MVDCVAGGAGVDVEDCCCEVGVGNTGVDEAAALYVGLMGCWRLDSWLTPVLTEDEGVGGLNFGLGCLSGGYC